MVRHRRRPFECAAILEIGGDSRRPEAVVAELGFNAGGRRAPADHRIGVCLRQHRARELVGATADRAEQRPLGIVSEVGAVEICRQVFFEIVVARHRVALAAFFPQPYPQPAVLCVDILDRHAERRANPSEGIDHQPDQRAIAQTGMCRHIDAVEQRPRLGRIEYRRLPAGDDVPGPAHRMRRIDRHDLAVDQPVEQVTQRGKPLFDARRRKLARRRLDPGGDMDRLDGRDRRHPGARAPGQKLLRSAGIGPARVRVADVGREEFKEAHRGARAGGGDERRDRGRSERDELVHSRSPSGSGEQPSKSNSSNTLSATA